MNPNLGNKISEIHNNMSRGSTDLNVCFELFDPKRITVKYKQFLIKYRIIVNTAIVNTDIVNT